MYDRSERLRVPHAIKIHVTSSPLSWHSRGVSVFVILELCARFVCILWFIWSSLSSSVWHLPYTLSRDIMFPLLYDSFGVTTYFVTELSQRNQWSSCLHHFLCFASFTIDCWALCFWWEEGLRQIKCTFPTQDHHWLDDLRCRRISLATLNMIISHYE